MHITFVKKILANGEPCQKCHDVEKRLEEAGEMAMIDEVLVADERDPTSLGMILAKETATERAPFFVVTEGDERKLYTVYFKFAKEVLGKKRSIQAENQEILNDNPDLDYI